MSTFPINPQADKIGVLREIDLPAKTGLTNKVLKLWRLTKLDQSDWYHDATDRRRRVWWCESAIRKLEAGLGSKYPELAPTIRREIPDTETMEVVRANFFNKRIIQCRRANNETVMVRVRDSAPYRPQTFTGRKMTVEVRKNGADGWVIEGRGPKQRSYV